MSMLNKQSTVSDVQEVSHTSNSAQLTGNTPSVHKKLSTIIDLGTTDHMCYQLCLFDNIRPLLNKVHNIFVPDGRRIKV